MIKPPYWYFGGKRKIIPDVWSRFGDVDNLIDPFFGSGAILLGRPRMGGRETVNDINCYLANFWRAVKADPKGVAEHAAWPMSEVDLIARQNWLVRNRNILEKMKTDPEFYHTKAAGWWVWGTNIWIGGGFCEKEIGARLPTTSNRGINRMMTQHGSGCKEGDINLYFDKLSRRTQNVRVACGEWDRVLGPSYTTMIGLTAVFLDPPYGEGSMDYESGGNQTTDIAKSARDWAVENGDNKLMRIAYCGYEGVVEFPKSWECVAWKASGGYGNAKRERIWFSPNCLKPKAGLFAI